MAEKLTLNDDVVRLGAAPPPPDEVVVGAAAAAVVGGAAPAGAVVELVAALWLEPQAEKTPRLRARPRLPTVIILRLTTTFLLVCQSPRAR